MSGGGWLPGMFRAGPGGELPVVSVTRLPPELGGRPARPVPQAEPGYGGAPGDPEFIAGSVTGYRWWALSPEGLLLGMHATWQPGENHARCLVNGVISKRRVHAPDAVVPDENCYCGFYAWWTVPGQLVPGSLVPVLGVIEGYGKVVIGSRGFRCGTARIMALCPLGAPDGAVAGLGRAYPGTQVYRSPDAMAAEFPPDPNYP